ncbi:hypothetical protein D9757_012088 [Collybiopsis confluens]|uniref:Ser-Thr-rich glycosyl-phosphatidyl-inositol-anchored membrane family-domain-containing protein n=1 Tax=Collybiopsis confluens TaxID=2823264 RepID=A0A8H5GAW0_9AGAR|nr:hypothetical protein D9757_014901 [Collybiopsis confluens]KAF5361546.1 hypothetical protein D9757_012088 [Collybiopsis confluens]
MIWKSRGSYLSLFGHNKFPTHRRSSSPPSSLHPLFPSLSSITPLKMFAKFCVLAAVLRLALALTMNAPANVTSGLVSDVTWTATDDDPTFSLELNHPSFGNSLALANNVNPQSGSPLSIQWPIVPADAQYTLSAVNISNINQVYSMSGSFAIAQAPTTVASSLSSTTFTSNATASGASTTATSLGVSTTGAPSGPGSTTGNAASSAASSASSSTASSGSFNGNGSGNGAASFKSGSTGAVAAVLAAVAGATLFL